MAHFLSTFSITIDGRELFSCFAENVQLAIFKLAKLAGVNEDRIHTTAPMTTVLHNGQPVDFDAAASLMDDTIRERLHDTVSDDTTPQQFFDAYLAAHLATFGTDFSAG